MLIPLTLLDPILSLSKIGHKRPQNHTRVHTNKCTLLPHPSAQPHLAQCCLWVGSGCWELRVSRSASDRWQHLRFSSSKSFKLWAKRVVWPRRGESFPHAPVFSWGSSQSRLSWRKSFARTETLRLMQPGQSCQLCSWCSGGWPQREWCQWSKTVFCPCCHWLHALFYTILLRPL